MAERHMTTPFLPHSSAGESQATKHGECKTEPHACVDSEAMVGMKDVSEFAGIDWERSLRGRLDEVVHYGLTILPYEELFHLAIKETSPQAWLMPELPRYLIGRLRPYLDSGHEHSILQGSRGLYLGYAEAFLTEFCVVLEHCFNNIRQQSQRDKDDKRQESLWVYAPRQSEMSCITQLPRSITDPIKDILTILDKCPIVTRYGVFLEDIFQTSGGVANVGQTLNLYALTEAWRREGYHEHLLRRYVWYRMIKQAPSRQREVNFFVSQLFDKPWEKRRGDQIANRTDELDLRIHYLR